MKVRLSESTTLHQFKTGYWYASELKAFAQKIGVPSPSKLRKDELEASIEHYLKTKEIKKIVRKNTHRSKIKDVEKGLTLHLEVLHYTNDKATKDFIEKEALKADPDFKYKSGARYRLNRWREEQLSAGKVITYADLIAKYIELCNFEGKFDKIPSGRYINFLSEFLSNEKNASRKQGIDAWKKLKALKIPKDYKSWKAYVKQKK